MKGATPLLILCFCAILQFTLADFEWTADYESNDYIDESNDFHELLSSNMTSLSFASMDKEDEEMYKNYLSYVSGKKDDTKKYYTGGLICTGKDAIYKNKLSMNYQYMCYNENGQADCATDYLYLDWLYVKRKSKENFMCNYPCGCWVGNPKVKSSKFYIRNVKDDWKSLEEQLNKWKVPKKMKEDYKKASFFEGSKFQNFNYFFHAGSSASFEAAIGAVRRRPDGKLQVGYLETQSTAWLATKWKTKRVPYTDYEQVCNQEYNSHSQNWETVCRQQSVYKGEIRQPKNKGPEGLKSAEIAAINNALQHVSFTQLKDQVQKSLAKKK